jgi:hypothetical protein
MIVGQKVVCVDDKFPLEVNKFYVALPKAGKTYTIRSVTVGVNWKGEPGEVCVHLREIINPKSSTPPYPERGFNAERFRPLDELPPEEILESEPETVYAE